MAAVAHRGATASTSNASTYASSAFTPALNELLVVFVIASGTVATPTMTDSQGLGFALVESTTKNGGVDSIYCFIATSLAAASSMTVTFNCTGDAATGAIILVAGVSGMSRVGQDALRQTAVTANHASGSAPAATFASAVLTGNPTIGCVGNGTSPANLTPPASWTELADTGYSTPTTGGEYASRDSGFTGTTITWGSNSASAFGVLCIELDTSTPTRTAPAVASVGAVATTATATMTPGLPAGLAAGDIACYPVAHGDNIALSVTPAGDGDTGWKIETELNSGTTLRLGMIWKRIQAGETPAAPTITRTGGTDGWIGRGLRITGAAATGDPFEAVATSTGTGTTVAVPNITSLTDETLILAILATSVGDTSGTGVMGEISGSNPVFQEKSDNNYEGAAHEIVLKTATGVMKTAGAIGTGRTALESGSGSTAGMVNGAIVYAITGVAVGGGGTAYALSCTPASYTLAGAAAAPIAARGAAVSPGTYALTGRAAGVSVGRVLRGSPAAYTVTGGGATTAATRTLPAVSAAYTLSGRPAPLLRTLRFSASPGGYAVTGAAATTPADRKLAAAAASYATAGQAVAAVVARMIDAAPGARTVTGAPTGVLAGRALPAAPAGYTITGAPVDLVYLQRGAYVLAAASAAFTVTGGDVAASTARLLAAAAAGYRFDAAASELLAARLLDADPVTVSLTGWDAGFGTPAPDVAFDPITTGKVLLHGSTGRVFDGARGRTGQLAAARTRDGSGGQIGEATPGRLETVGVRA